MAFFLRVDLPLVAPVGAEAKLEALNTIARGRKLRLKDGKRAFRFVVRDEIILDVLENIFNAGLYPEIENYGVYQDMDLAQAVDAAFARRGLKASWFRISLDDLDGIDMPVDLEDGK